MKEKKENKIMKKSIRNLIAGAAMAISVFAASLTTFAAQYVQTDMNFRSGASKTATVIGSVPAGAQVEVLGQKDDFDLISYNGVTGYIHTGNLADSYTAPKQTYTGSQTQQAAQSSANSSMRTVYVSNGYLAIRTAPAADYNNEINHIGLKTGDQVQITGGYVQGTGFGGEKATYVWVYAPKFGVSGYVNAAYLG